MGIHAESKLDSKMLDMIKQLTKYLNHFPSFEKYALTSQIRNTAYDVYGLVVECQKRYHKKTALSSLDIRHEQLRMFLRLANELSYFEFKDGATTRTGKEAQERYHSLSLKIDEIGRLIGGWVREDRGRSDK